MLHKIDFDVENLYIPWGCYNGCKILLFFDFIWFRSVVACNEADHEIHINTKTTECVTLFPFNSRASRKKHE